MGAVDDISGLVDLMTRAVRAAGTRDDPCAPGDAARLAAALEALRFGAAGPLPVLRAMAEGGPITERMRAGIFHINPAGPEADAALRRLVESYAEREALTPAERQRLRAVAEIRTGLRWDISQITDRAVNMGVPYDPAEVALLVRRIEALNAAIIELESKLRERTEIR
ncbi:hypothetical protein HKCCE3408_04340 [Rhodobacterales bacterium HKCCE3408]|nr:hypothetical protein [Rhodobacterales bacterium HKCCE3408]